MGVSTVETMHVIVRVCMRIIVRVRMRVIVRARMSRIVHVGARSMLVVRVHMFRRVMMRLARAHADSVMCNSYDLI